MRVGEHHAAIASRHGQALPVGEIQHLVEQGHIDRQAVHVGPVSAARQVPEVEAGLAARGDEGPAVRAERERAEVVGRQLNLGHEANVGCRQGGRGLRAKLGQVATRRGHDGESCQATQGLFAPAGRMPDPQRFDLAEDGVVGLGPGNRSCAIGLVPRESFGLRPPVRLLSRRSFRDGQVPRAIGLPGKAPRRHERADRAEHQHGRQHAAERPRSRDCAGPTARTAPRADARRARIGSSARNRRRSSAIASADWYRAFGSFSIAFRTIVSRSRGIRAVDRPGPRRLLGLDLLDQLEPVRRRRTPAGASAARRGSAPGRRRRPGRPLAAEPLGGHVAERAQDVAALASAPRRRPWPGRSR